METDLIIDNLKLRPTKGQFFSAGWFSFFLTSIALFMLYVTNFTNWYSSTPQSPSKVSLTHLDILFGTLLLIGSWGCFRLTQIFKMTPIYSNLDKSEKALVVQNLTNVFKWSVKVTSANKFKFYYLKYFFSTPLNIVILTDEKGFYINVRDITSFSLDFGRYYWFTKKIKKEIENQLPK